MILRTFSSLKNPALNFLKILSSWILLFYKPLSYKKMCISIQLSDWTEYSLTQIVFCTQPAMTIFLSFFDNLSFHHLASNSVSQLPKLWLPQYLVPEPWLSASIAVYANYPWFNYLTFAYTYRNYSLVILTGTYFSSENILCNLMN